MSHLFANRTSRGKVAIATTMARMNGNTYCMLVRNETRQFARDSRSQFGEALIRIRFAAGGGNGNDEPHHRSIGAMPGQGIPKNKPFHREFIGDDAAALLEPVIHQ